VPKYFKDLPKREWTRTASDAEYRKLLTWWDAQEEQVLIEVPEAADHLKTYISLMFAALGFETELDDILSELALKAKADAALAVVDRLGYRASHDVPKGREYEWMKKSIELGREKRDARLAQFFNDIK
jgi:hypothetical protein